MRKYCIFIFLFVVFNDNGIHDCKYFYFVISMFEEFQLHTAIRNFRTLISININPAFKVEPSESVANCSTYGHKAIKLVRGMLRRNACTLCGGTASHKLSSPTKDSAK